MRRKTPASSSQRKFLFSLLVMATMVSISQSSFAESVTLKTNQIINTPTSYKNVTLNINGGFIIQPGGSLDIENSIVNVQISPGNPFFTYMTTGALTLKNNTFNVTVSGITPNPNNPQPYELIKIDQGALTVTHNSFTVNQPYSVAFVTTNQNYATTGFLVNQNTIKNFHGGIYLSNSSMATVDENTFTSVSLSNIWNSGNSNEFSDNIMSFPGNLATGNGFDIINSSNLTLRNNIISSSVGYGIHIMGGANLTMESNKITDSQSYGIMIENPATLKNARYIAQLAPLHHAKAAGKFVTYSNSNIILNNNYIGQNRYGFTAENADSVTVIGNVFIQRFSDPDSRQFWTNNSNLLSSVTNLLWLNNYYKEAFTQDVPGINDLTKQFVDFPEDGGVTL